MARKFIEVKVGCMAKAFDDEPTFVLLARDKAAPLAIRAWIEERLRLGLNRDNDQQIGEAEHLLLVMQAEQSEWAEARRKQKVEEAAR